MDPRIILGKILQRFSDNGFCQASGYNKFEYLRENKNAVYIGREKDKDTRIGFEKLTLGIEAFQRNPSLYNEGPNALRDFGVTHVNSPVWSLLHLMKKEDYH